MRRTANSTRRVAEEEQSRFLIAFLNAPLKGKSRKAQRAKDRVAILLSLVRSLQRLRSEPDEWKLTSWGEAILWNKIVNNTLKTYPFHFALLPPEIARREGKEPFSLVICRLGRTAKSPEHKAVETTLLGMMRGWLHRVRRCRCNIWYFATKNWQTFHHPNCRKHYHRVKRRENEKRAEVESWEWVRKGE